MFKQSTLRRALVAAAICTSSFAASAAAYTIDFNGVASGSNANSDATAITNGVTFASGVYADVVDGNFNVIGQHWIPYSLATDGVDPAIFARSPSSISWGTGSNALDARFDQVLVQFANPSQLTGFSFNLDNSSFGNLQASNILFLDADGKTIFTSNGFFQNTTSNFSVSFASPLTVSAVLLPSGKLYDDVSVAAVPEPETYAMMLGGLGLLGFMARRRKPG